MIFIIFFQSSLDTVLTEQILNRYIAFFFEKRIHEFFALFQDGMRLA